MRDLSVQQRLLCLIAISIYDFNILAEYMKRLWGEKWENTLCYMPILSMIFRDLLQTIKDKGLKVTQHSHRVTIDRDPTARAEMLASDSMSYEDMNNYSIKF